ncbi:MAG: hypothetical protein WC076_04945 [Terrimicrobiaceae bacterium]|jgi:hypothetical protein|nr:hypothetical protein [Terrimicrobiaceae bacterium]
MPSGTSQAGDQQASPITAVNPDAPGNAISSEGQTVAVEGTELLDDGSTALDLAVSPADTTMLDAKAEGKWPRGFTHEEQLFRAKWGWSAFDQAQKIAAESRP